MEHRATKTRRRKGKHEGETDISIFVIPFVPSCLRGSVLFARGDRASKCIKMQHPKKSSQRQAMAGPGVTISAGGLDVAPAQTHAGSCTKMHDLGDSSQLR